MDYRLSPLYRLRRWLVRKLIPRELTVFMCEDLRETGLYDAKNMGSWFSVKIQWWDQTFFGETEEGLTEIRRPRK